MNICHITVSGRLTGDAKLGKSESGSDFARFTIARNRKNRDGEEVAEFYEGGRGAQERRQGRR